MESYDVKFKKRYGQNFLKDVNIVKKIVRIADINSKSLVIEVGPGGAIMTRELASVSDNVLAYEIDNELQSELEKRLEDCKNVSVLFQDFLQSDIISDISLFSYDYLYFVSNVPYYITTPIILKLINSGLSFTKIVVMVQKEVGERFATKCGCKEYGSISVLLQYFFNIKKEMSVSRSQFIPVPNVDSVVLSFVPRNNLVVARDVSFFEKLVRDSFQYKRKTIRNNLKNYNLDIVSKVLNDYGFDLNVRAEEIDVEIFVVLANALLEK